MSQRDRRREPYPWTWEPAAALGTTLVAIVVAAAQLGRAAANLGGGAGILFPPDVVGWVTSTPAVLTGHSTAGLAYEVASPAGPVLLGWCVGFTGVLLLTSTVTLMVVAWRRFGPGGVQGVADPAEVRATLGLRRLRRNARLIRPDLHQQHPGVGE